MLPTVEEWNAADPQNAPHEDAPIADVAGRTGPPGEEMDAWASWRPHPLGPGDVGGGYASAGAAWVPTMAVTTAGASYARAGSGSASSSSKAPPDYRYRGAGEVVPVRNLPPPPPLTIPVSERTHHAPETSYEHGVPRGEARNPVVPRGHLRDQIQDVRNVFFSEQLREKGASTWRTLKNYLKTAVDIRGGKELPKGLAEHIQEWIQDPQVFDRYDRMNRLNENSEEYLGLRDELIIDYIRRAPASSKLSVRWKAEIGRMADQLAPLSAKAQRQILLHQLTKAIEGKQGKGGEVEKAKSWWAAQGISMTGGIDPSVYHVAYRLAHGMSVEEL